MDLGASQHAALGPLGGVYVKMAFTQAGFDVYSPEVDDRGLDFVVRAGPGRYYEIQVKSGRIRNTYVFMRKSHFEPAPGLFLALVIVRRAREPGHLPYPVDGLVDPGGSFRQ